jgi:hypothetical protein
MLSDIDRGLQKIFDALGDVGPAKVQVDERVAI